MIEKIKELEGRLATLEEALKNVLRVGTVVSRDAANCRVRVQFADNDGLVSYWCQVLAGKTHRDTIYLLPDVDELVVCAFLPFGHEQGFVVGSAYNVQDRPPASANDHRLLVRDDGDNEVLMDRICKKMRVTTTQLHLFGDLVVHGKIFDYLGTITEHRNAGYPRDPGANAPQWACDD